MKDKTLFRASATIVVLLSSLAPPIEAQSSFLLESMLRRIEDETYAFAHAMEELILNKCNYTSDEICYKQNYHPCFSELREASCPGKDYAIQKCGSGKEGGCGGFFDFTRSTVSAAPNSNNDPFHLQSTETIRVKDGVCTTLRIEDYMKNVTETYRSYWQDLGVHPPTLFYGTDDGVFRKFPGSPRTCPNGMNDYDPRVRPWYVAASSGPKDVILVLDTSGSMGSYNRLNIMKKAAKAVVKSLGVGDYFAVIAFNDDARVIGDESIMIRATDENKQKIVDQIDLFDAINGTNYYNAYNLAFQTFKSSKLQDRTSGCHKALMFLSDGKMNDDKDDLFDLISREKTSDTVLFTYSFGDSNIGSVPGEIACSYNGIWAQISDYGDLAKSMGAYYKYFAYGLGDNENDQFVAWVEPYQFATGVGMGTTASAPVYDRTVSPPVLAGVVGMDISFAALQQSIGGIDNESKEAVLLSIVERSTAVCPNLNVTDCQLESLRKYGSDDEGNDAAICKTCNSEIQPLKSGLCPYYPNELWSNRLNQGRTFEERTCCNVGAEPRLENTLTNEEIKNGVCVEGFAIGRTIGMAVGIVVAVVVVSVVSYMFIRSRRTRFDNNPYMSTNNNSNTGTNAGVETYAGNNASSIAEVQAYPIPSFENGVVVLPAPVAPAVSRPVSNAH